MLCILCFQSKGIVQHLYLGRTAPMFTEMRVLRQSTGDDHLVCLTFSSVLANSFHVLFVVAVVKFSQVKVLQCTECRFWSWE